MLFNILGFNLSWFGLILIGNKFIPLAVIFLAIHLYLVKHKTCEIKLILTVTTIGIAVDSLLYYFGVYRFNDPALPIWLLVLWACFAATISTSLGFLSSSVLLQLLAGVLAPLSYLAAVKFSVISLNYPLLVYFCILACLWSPLMVVFFNLKKSFYAMENSTVKVND